LTEMPKAPSSTLDPDRFEIQHTNAGRQLREGEHKTADIVLRPGTPADAAACGNICYEAFKAICTTHNFPPDFPTPEVAKGLLSMFLAHRDFYSVVAESEGRIVGSNFLDERSIIAGVGPITVDPTGQNRGVGGRLMQDVLDRAAQQKAVGVRLLQSGYHNRALCLYTKLGFRTREPVSVLQGAPLGQRFAGYEVRPATTADVTACNQICNQVHGFDRAGELRDAIEQNTASVVEHLGRIAGYTTGIVFFGHSVAQTNRDLMALIGAAPEFGGPGFLLPTRNHEVFSHCLEAGLKLVFQMTLMTVGLYNEPAGAYLAVRPVLRRPSAVRSKGLQRSCRRRIDLVCVTGAERSRRACGRRNGLNVFGPAFGEARVTAAMRKHRSFAGGSRPSQFLAETANRKAGHFAASAQLSSQAM
jgi:predicted N-acetyltransferase YhbS